MPVVAAGHNTGTWSLSVYAEEIDKAELGVWHRLYDSSNRASFVYVRPHDKRVYLVEQNSMFDWDYDGTLYDDLWDALKAAEDGDGESFSMEEFQSFGMDEGVE